MSGIVADIAAEARRAFAHHQIREQTDRSWLLRRPYWGKPEKKRYMTQADAAGEPTGWDSAFSTEVICGRHGDLIVNGDIAVVVFAHGPADPRARVHWMGERYVGDYVDCYLMEKAAIGMTSGLSDVIERFDIDAARRDIEGWLSDEPHRCRVRPWREPYRCRACLLRNVLDDLDDLGIGFGHEGLVRYLVDVLGYDYMDGRFDVGRTPAPRVIYAHAALRRLCELFDGT